MERPCSLMLLEGAGQVLSVNREKENRKGGLILVGGDFSVLPLLCGDYTLINNNKQLDQTLVGLAGKLTVKIGACSMHNEA